MPDSESTPEQRRVRLLINDPDSNVFTAVEIDDFLALTGNVVKRAAALAIDTIADNEALVSKVIRDGDLATDGPKVADSLRKRAAALRAEAAADKADEDVDSGESSYFGIVNLGSDARCRPELTTRPCGW